MSVEINPKQARYDVEEWIKRKDKKFLLDGSSLFNFDFYKEKIAEGFKYAVIILPHQVILFLSEDKEMIAERDNFIEQHGGFENIEFYETHAREVIVLFKE